MSDPAKARFIRDNDRICLAVAQATLESLRETFPVPNGLPNVDAARRIGPGYVAAYRRALAQRRALVVPRADAAAFQRHWTSYAKALNDLLAVHERIGSETTSAQYKAWLTPVSEEFYALNRFERNYGFKTCGSEPGPNDDRRAGGS
jgi:hypothetical protein